MRSELAKRVVSMFRTIDQCQWSRLSEFFHSDVEYVRPGYDPINGIDNLLEFYMHRRIVRVGEHRIETICASSRAHAISATGSFIGVDRGGHNLSVRFCDVYQFETGKIRRRETFFNRPAV